MKENDLQLCHDRQQRRRISGSKLSSKTLVKVAMGVLHIGFCCCYEKILQHIAFSVNLDYTTVRSIGDHNTHMASARNMFAVFQFSVLRGDRAASLIL